MEPQISIAVEVNFIPSETVRVQEVYTFTQEGDVQESIDRIVPNLTGVGFSYVPRMAFAIAV